MSWLSEIEKDYLEGIYPTGGAIRMARVIRELAIRAKAYEWITDNMPSPVLCSIFDALEGEGIIIEDNLSSDAKELLKCSDG